MKTLTAKIVTAHFEDWDYDQNGKKILHSYPVHIFENGLVLVPCISTNDYFFDAPDNIEGSGCTQFIGFSSNETIELIEYTALQLVESWGNSCSEFGVDKDVLPKIKELIKK